MIAFNYYAANIKASRPLGLVTLYQFFDAIRNPKKHIIEVYDLIKRAELDGDMKRKAELKEKLYSFTPCVTVKYSRSYADIQSFTGLMVLDFDHLKPNEAKELKEFIYNTYDFIIATWLSASKCGVRALVNIPIVETVKEFQSLYAGIEHEEMGQYIGFDTAPKNPVLPLFLSYDPDIFYGDTPGMWSVRYNPPVAAPLVQYKYDANPTKVEKIIKSSIDKIIDEGHPQLRAASYALGGYVGSGLIEKENAESLICELIRSNGYLSQKPQVYERTAIEMINKGISQPLYL